MTFAELGLEPRLVNALSTLGYEEPTPIQAEAIPIISGGSDLLGQAATGTGKTAAFALPLLQRISGKPASPGLPAVVVLVPTRELAMQVAEAFHRYGAALGTSVTPIYGGQAFDQQIRTLRRGVHVVVATPGRALDHLRRKTLDLSSVETLVLDEADEMLDMGFADEIDAILDAAPADRQTLLFSATMPPRIAAIAERHLRNPRRVQIARATPAAGELPRVRQVAYIVSRAQKIPALSRVLDSETPTLGLIFCRTRTEVDALTATLGGRGHRAEALHGGMSQEARDRVMKRTRSGAVDLLIATDVAARGLDIEQLSHVINFNVPESPAAYVHRIGRTGRAGREGAAITLVEPREHRLLRNIEHAVKQRIPASQLPSVSDVHNRQLAITTTALRDAIARDGSDRYRAVVDSLADEFDVMQIAMAAVQLVHERSHTATTDDEITFDAAPAEPKSRKAPGKRPARTAGLSRIYIGAGKKQNLRPTDVVGAITNEAKLPASEIGSIEISDRFTLVELPEARVEQVVRALRASTIKGKKLTVRRDLAGRRET